VAEAKAWYTLKELASMANKDQGELRRLLKSLGILDKRFRFGRDYIVYFCVLTERLPELWNSILEIEALRIAILEQQQD
jgi:hypothetical protein